MEMLILAYFFVGLVIALLTVLQTSSEEFKDFHRHMKGGEWEMHNTVILALFCFFLWPVVLIMAYQVHRGD